MQQLKQVLEGQGYNPATDKGCINNRKYSNDADIVLLSMVTIAFGFYMLCNAIRKTAMCKLEKKMEKNNIQNNCFFLINIFYAFIAAMIGIAFCPYFVRYFSTNADQALVFGLCFFGFIVTCFFLYAAKILAYEIAYVSKIASHDAKNQIDAE